MNGWFKMCTAIDILKNPETCLTIGWESNTCRECPRILLSGAFALTYRYRRSTGSYPGTITRRDSGHS